MRDLLSRHYVTFTGGKSGRVLLKGFVDHPGRISALTTVYDSGGSTGRICEEFPHALPMGDLASCLAALAPPSPLRDHIERRLKGGTGSLAGHRNGNLMLLDLMDHYGPVGGVRMLGEMLGIPSGRQVLPISTDRANIHGRSAGRGDLDTLLTHESAIDTRPPDEQAPLLATWLDPKTVISREAAEAIMDADVLIVGPGDFATSIRPMFHTWGTWDAVKKSNGRFVVVLPQMTKGSETYNYKPADFCRKLLEDDFKDTVLPSNGWASAPEAVDAVVIDDSAIPPTITKRYWEQEKAVPVRINTKEELDALRQYARRIIPTPLLDRTELERGLVRHNSNELARVIMTLW